MSLFLYNESDSQYNWLPQDGVVNYYGKLFSEEESNTFFEELWHNIDWRNDEAMMFGKKIITKRKVAWYGDSPFRYTYSKVTKEALPWTPELLTLKNRIETATGETFNSCLLNLYHSGDEGMAWHSDDEIDLKRNGAIGSITFGAERKFAFKHKHIDQKVEMLLEHGSVLVMKDTTQTFWLHRLPPTKKVKKPRINLTFRTIENQQF
ncbi:alpha-ketoglutarate-dependent dioxygenase AlkB family protein [Flectobacillus roseus]|uniref:alpha-ketoglutarate-dependent dioxygenase AlkB family protein n=1 Tax=Flectobacillus roseus TaxID=502259 RepID=UPI0024B762B5|nr:alpha-ketoglutarate-dependent dioxygenase AlkB [Flectobacillus roseus]MDI9868907.1 alpha-ketoglutarate-dependent dioxygenase AlkB [Flectobacillus roseus]